MQPSTKKTHSGTYIAAFEPQCAYVWDAQTYEPLLTCRIKQSDLTEISINQARKRLFGYCIRRGCIRSHIVSFDLESGENVSSFHDGENHDINEPHGFDVNSSGTRVLGRGSRSIMDADTGGIIVEMMLPERMEVSGVYFMKGDTQTLLYDNKQLCVCSAHSGELLYSISSTYYILGIDRNSCKLFLCHQHLYLLDLQEQERQQQQEKAVEIATKVSSHRKSNPKLTRILKLGLLENAVVAVCNESTIIVKPEYGQLVRIVDINTMSVLLTIDLVVSTTVMAYMPHNHSIVVYRRQSKKFRIVDIMAGKSVGTLKAHRALAEMEDMRCCGIVCSDCGVVLL